MKTVKIYTLYEPFKRQSQQKSFAFLVAEYFWKPRRQTV